MMMMIMMMMMLPLDARNTSNSYKSIRVNTNSFFSDPIDIPNDYDNDDDDDDDNDGDDDDDDNGITWQRYHCCWG